MVLRIESDIDSGRGIVISKAIKTMKKAQRAHRYKPYQRTRSFNKLRTPVSRFKTFIKPKTILESSSTKEYSAPKGTLAKKNKPQPWVGPLPPPRKSLRQMIDDAISIAKVISSPYKKHMSRSAQPSS
jgi:hypothetical protein